MILAQKITNPPAGVGRYSFNLFKKKKKHAVVLESGGWGKLIGGGSSGMCNIATVWGGGR